MPNGHDKKEYGKHEYPNHDGTSDCKFGCGCWMGSTRSGGPLGLDPFGTCPQNPVDGKLLGGNSDYENLVTYRIRDLESRVYEAEVRLKRVSPSKAKLAEELVSVKKELSEKKALLASIWKLLEKNG